MPTVMVSKRGEARIVYGHPWVFRSDVARADGAGEGSVVRVIGHQGRALGHAFHSSRSEIRLRMLTRAEDAAAVLRRRPPRRRHRLARDDRPRGGGVPRRARRGRRPALAGGGPLRRLPGGADPVPGHRGPEGRDRGAISSRACSRKGVLERNDPRVRTLEGLEQRVGLLHGQVPDLVEVTENGVRLEADLWKGQKTGLFLDQRENHAMAAQLRARAGARRLHLQRRVRAPGLAAGGRGAGGGRLRGRAGAGAAQRGAQRHHQRRPCRRRTCSTCCTTSTPRGGSSTP